MGHLRARGRIQKVLWLAWDFWFSVRNDAAQVPRRIRPDSPEIPVCDFSRSLELESTSLCKKNFNLKLFKVRVLEEIIRAQLVTVNYSQVRAGKKHTWRWFCIFEREIQRVAEVKSWSSVLCYLMIISSLWTTPKYKPLMCIYNRINVLVSIITYIEVV